VSPNPIDEAACDWAARREAGLLSHEEEARFAQWLAADVRHRGAYARARAGLLAIDRLAAIAGPIAEQTLRQRAKTERSPYSLAARWALAASLLLVCTSVAIFGVFGSRADRFESGTGEQRRVGLSDGSQLELDSDSTALVAFSPKVREIRLDRGEAMFRVAKDHVRPFVVHASGLNVRAVGTAFAVRTQDERTEVSVTEGVVEVWRDSDPSSVQRVHALERAVAGADAVTVVAVPQARMERDLAWQDGLVSFDGERLSDAILQINRRSRLKLDVEDPKLASQPIVGIFQATDAVSFANAASVALGAVAVRDGEIIHLRAAPKSSGQ
jgi:transmembrane sensor